MNEEHVATQPPKSGWRGRLAGAVVLVIYMAGTLYLWFRLPDEPPHARRTHEKPLQTAKPLADSLEPVTDSVKTVADTVKAVAGSVKTAAASGAVPVRGPVYEAHAAEPEHQSANLAESPPSPPVETTSSPDAGVEPEPIVPADPPESAPAAERHPPKKETRATASKQRPAPRPTKRSAEKATVALAISPWGEVFVDGRRVGASPPLTELKLPPGSYLIEIRNADLAPLTRFVSIDSGEDAKIKYRFK